jgi:ribonuclease HI
MVAWSIELSEYDLTFSPKASVKSQVLADFVMEMTSPPVAADKKRWMLSVDGSSNLRGSGVGILLERPDRVLIEQSLCFAFKASNNQTEYEVLIAGMKLAREMEVTNLRAKSDSQLSDQPSVWRISNQRPPTDEISGESTKAGDTI